MLTFKDFSHRCMLQVKKNLINVSYHIAQYTNIISDLRCEIQRLKKKIADQASRQLNPDRTDIRHVQGKDRSTLPYLDHKERLTDYTDFFYIFMLVTIVYLVLFFFCYLSPHVAEVQAHSTLQSQAETDQLKEQLLDAFRQQMEIRKSLMELENSNMEIQIDTSKHLLAIAESVFSVYVTPLTCSYSLYALEFNSSN